MNALSLFPFSLPRLSFQRPEPRIDETSQADDTERRRIVGELIASGACDSEYGVQMLMSVYPQRF